MSTLPELRAKWFLTFDGSEESFPPSKRHASSTVAPHTDGNRVQLLADGQRYMKVWHDAIVRMHGVAGAEVYHAGWRMEGVRTLGQSNAASNALDVIVAANKAGVQFKIALSRHGGGTASVINTATVAELRLRGVWTACTDNRYPPLGSNHPKAVCLKNPSEPKAVLGSIDISASRWDRDAHRRVDPERHPRHGKPTHDTGVLIEGPAVGDIERTFAERWNDSTRTFGLEPLLPRQPLITTPPSTSGPVGTHSVQALRTYGRTRKFYGYSWSPVGEFTAWAAYINAIKRAERYIYIEDQYFLPFGYPPLFDSTGTARESDPVWQLGEALKRGVKVIVLVPNNAEDMWHAFQQHQRDLGVHYLETITVGGQLTDFTVAWPEVDNSPVYVHSKLLLVDDEYAMIGSANVCQRSMTFDTELSVGVVDEAGQLVRDMRKQIWAEHLQRDPATLTDPDAACALFHADALAGRGRVRWYEAETFDDPPLGHGPMIRRTIDPYGGPPRGTAVFTGRWLEPEVA